MKRILIALLALSGLLVTAAPAAAASQRAAALRRDLGSGVKVAQHRETGAVRFVGAAAGKRIARPSGVSASAPPADAARAFLGRHADAFGLRNQARELQVESTRGGSRPSVRFQQVEGGVPVIAGELVANLDAQRNLLSVSGETLPDAKVDTSPRLSSSAARDAATAAIAKGESVSGARLDAGIPELGIYDARLLGGPGPNEPTLVWQVEVKGRAGLLIDQLVFVDAQTGSVALHINQVENIKNRSVCDGNNIPTGSQVPCTSPVATEAAPPGAGDDADVHTAFEFAGDTYDFYFTRFGRDSLDGAGLPLKSTVDYCDPNDACPLQNAFWNGQQMAYGDGFASADDVVGHELTHGVTEFSSHLFYYFQSGAINESLSDVFGEFVDQTNGVGNDTPAVKWQLGEDLLGRRHPQHEEPAGVRRPRPDDQPELHDRPRRGRRGRRPHQQRRQQQGRLPDHRRHRGRARRRFNGRTITGLGVTKAARIYYEVETAFLTSGSDYADLGSALAQACDNLVGTVGITAADCTQVRSAVAATEMATNPPNAPAPEAPAAACGANQVLQSRFFDDMESDSSDANWFRLRQRLGPRLLLRPQRRLPPLRRGRRVHRRPLARAGQERRVPGRRDVVPALRPRLRVRGLQHHRLLRRRRARVQHQRRLDVGGHQRAASRRRLQRHHRQRDQPALRPGGVREREQRLPRDPRQPELPGWPERALPLAHRHRQHGQWPRLVHRRRPHLLVPAGHRRRRRPEQRRRLPRPWWGRRTAARRPRPAAAGRPRPRVAAAEAAAPR